MKSFFFCVLSQRGVFIDSAEMEDVSGTTDTQRQRDERVVYVELLNTSVSVCSYRFRPMTYSGVYFMMERIHEEVPALIQT